MGYLCKKRNICLWTLNRVKIQKTLNKHSVTLSILHCSGLFCEISPSTQPSTSLTFAVSRRMAKHLWHLPRARSEPLQTNNVRDADNTHYSICFLCMYFKIYSYHIYSYLQCLPDFLSEIWYKPGRSTMKDASAARESRMEQRGCCEGDRAVYQKDTS